MSFEISYGCEMKPVEKAKIKSDLVKNVPKSCGIDSDPQKDISLTPAPDSDLNGFNPLITANSEIDENLSHWTPDPNFAQSLEFASSEPQESSTGLVPDSSKIDRVISQRSLTWGEQLNIELTSVRADIRPEELHEQEISISSILDNLQYGIQTSLDSSEDPQRDLLMTDFGVVEELKFRSRYTSIASDFHLYVYAPVAFRFFRELFGIRTDDFKQSVCEAPLYRTESGGSSGSDLYTTQDDRFVLKTVDKKESKFLLKLLPGYYLNLTQHTKTLLPKYYGLYCYAKGIRNIRVLIMNNILPRIYKFYEKYDIKGSTYSKRKHKGEIPCGKTFARVTLKDLDFLERHRDGFYLHSTIYSVLFKAVERDCKVLESYSIMDYSLLLGIVEPESPGNVPNLQGSHAANSLKSNGNLIGPFAARTNKGDTVYLFLGIIDILQSYTWKRKIESCLKSLYYRSNTVSVTRPDLYSRRFQDFLKNIVFKCIPRLLPSKKICCSGITK